MHAAWVVQWQHEMRWLLLYSQPARMFGRSKLGAAGSAKEAHLKSGCSSFMTSLRGKRQGHVHVLVCLSSQRTRLPWH